MSDGSAPGPLGKRFTRTLASVALLQLVDPVQRMGRAPYRVRNAADGRVVEDQGAVDVVHKVSGVHDRLVLRCDHRGRAADLFTDEIVRV